jgi:hypothetical protein
MEKIGKRIPNGFTESGSPPPASPCWRIAKLVFLKNRQSQTSGTRESEAKTSTAIGVLPHNEHTAFGFDDGFADGEAAAPAAAIM